MSAVLGFGSQESETERRVFGTHARWIVRVYCCCRHW